MHFNLLREFLYFYIIIIKIINKTLIYLRKRLEYLVLSYWKRLGYRKVLEIHYRNNSKNQFKKSTLIHTFISTSEKWRVFYICFCWVEDSTLDPTLFWINSSMLLNILKILMFLAQSQNAIFWSTQEAINFQEMIITFNTSQKQKWYMFQSL